MWRCAASPGGRGAAWPAARWCAPRRGGRFRPTGGAGCGRHGRRLGSGFGPPAAACSPPSRACGGGAARPVAVRRPGDGGRRCACWWCLPWRLSVWGGRGAAWTGAAEPTACRLQREGGNFTGLGDPGRACAATGLVCSCYCVRSATVSDGGGGALPCANGAAALVPAPLPLCADHASWCRGETAWEAS